MNFVPTFEENETAALSIREDYQPNLDEKLWEWLNSPRYPNFDDFGPLCLAEFQVDMERRVPRERVFTAWLNTDLVGALWFHPNNRHAGQFHGLVIAPKYRRKGFGEALFNMAISTLKEKSYYSVTSLPFADNEPIKSLLLKIGFRCTGCIPGATLRDGKLTSMSIFTREL